MDKNKSEKLKEILNQTLSSEDIEKKLKEEIRNSALKKKKEKIQEKEEQELEEVQEKKESFKTIEKTKTSKENKNPKKELKNKDIGINILLYLVGIIAILLLAIVIYLFTNEKEIKTNKVSEITKEKNITSTNSKKIELKEEVKTSEKPKEIIKIKEVIKEKIVTKTIKLDKKNFKEFYNSSKFNTLKCYNFKAGDTFPTSKCKNDLKEFLVKNESALRFEVIPVIAEDDNKIYQKIQSNIKTMDKEFQEKVKEYMFRGLSRERVLETSWIIKDILGEDVILTPTNYYVKSVKNNKGIIIKAYH